MRQARVGLTAFTLIGVIVACSDDLTAPKVTIPAQVQLATDSLVLIKGARSSWPVMTVVDGSGATLTPRDVRWTSRNPTVIRVDSGSQELVAAGKGATTLTVTATVGKAAVTRSIPAVVPRAAIQSVVLSPDTLELAVGTSARFSVLAYDADGSFYSDLSGTWQSLSPAVVATTPSGTLVALSSGVGTVGVTIDGVHGSRPVIVRASGGVGGAQPASVIVEPGTLSITKASVVSLRAVVRTQSGVELVGAPVTWTSSQPMVVGVTSSGTLVPVGGGEAVVRATSGVASGFAVVSVQGDPAPDTTVAAIQLSRTSYRGYPGDTTSVTVALVNAAGTVLTGKPIAWLTSDSAVATISPLGTISLIGAGAAVLTIRSGEVSATIATTVDPIKVSTVIVSPLSVSVTRYGTVALSASVRDTRNRLIAGRTVKWGLADSTVATITAEGRLTGLLEGATSVYATVDSVRGTAPVLVLRAPVTQVTTDVANLSLVVGQNRYVTATCRDQAGAVVPGATPVWLSLSVAVATVDGGGLVLARGAGSTTLQVTCGNDTKLVPVTVTAAPTVTQVTTDVASLTLAVGQSKWITAVCRDAGNNIMLGQSIAWISLSQAVATVDGSGLVLGRSAGNTTVQVTCANTVSKAIPVTVTP
ncbi:MAG: hypothetical protein C0497_03860 [Gemmatimonas sp.]|nr:hypothetical protein [Gemmatimonas sp.]